MYRCHEDARARVMDYIANEPEMTLFIRGDVENFGFDSDTAEVWAQEENGEIACLLLKFLDYYIVYSRRSAFDAAEVAAFLKDRTVDCISGKLADVRQVLPYFPGHTLRSTRMCRCNAASIVDAPLPEGAFVRPLTEADVPEMVRFYLQIDEFSASYRGKEEKAREQILRNMETGSACIGVFMDGQLVSAVETTASTSISTMIVGVATHPAYRKRGLALAAVSALCRECFARGKSFLCLFFDNPEAGRIYRRIGFVEIGDYAMLEAPEDPEALNE